MTKKVITLLFIYVAMGSLTTSFADSFEFDGVYYSYLKGQVHPKDKKKEKLRGFKLIKGLSSELDVLGDFNDTDSDGIPDVMDSDIDNDLVNNYLDQYPFDKNRHGEDLDNDQIPDFLDFEVLGKRKKRINSEMALIQERVFKEKGVLIVFNKGKFNLEELRVIQHELLDGTFKNINNFKRLKVIIKENSGPHFANFNKFWHGATFFQNDYHRKQIKNFRGTFVHEVFHSLRYGNTKLYDRFLKASGWSIKGSGTRKKFFYQTNEGIQAFTSFDFRFQFNLVKEKLSGANFVSDYSKNGPEEMFAEVMTATAILLDERQDEFNLKRYYNLEVFGLTELYWSLVDEFKKLEVKYEN